MGKRLANDEEMDSIIKHLDRQDKTLNEILIVIKGSVALGVDGIIAKQLEMTKSVDLILSDVAHLQRFKKDLQDSNIKKEIWDLKQWKRDVEQSKGKINMWDVFKTVSAFIVAVSAFAAGLLALKQLFEK